MSYFPDLSPYGRPELIAVGWLEAGKPFSQGDVSEGFFDKLTELLVDPWEPAISCGLHRCQFCRFSGGPGGFRYKDRDIILGASNLYVPDRGKLLVAPSLILHYIDAHGYSPPKEFQDAVLRCPRMRSMDYLKALLQNAPKGFVKS